MHRANAGCKRGPCNATPKSSAGVGPHGAVNARLRGWDSILDVTRNEGERQSQRWASDTPHWVHVGNSGRRDLGSGQSGRVCVEETRRELGRGDGEAGAGQRGWAGRGAGGEWRAGSKWHLGASPAARLDVGTPEGGKWGGEAALGEATELPACGRP